MIKSNYFLSFISICCASLSGFGGGFGCLPTAAEKGGMGEVVGEHYFLKIGEVVVGEVTDPTSNPLAGSSTQAGDISVSVGSGMDRVFWEWIEASLSLNYSRKSGSIIAADFNYEAKAERDFFDALITEIDIPAMDGASKEDTTIHFKLRPVKTEDKKISKGSISAESLRLISDTYAPLNSGAFTINIAGFKNSASQISKIEGMVIRFPEEAKEGSKLEVSDLVATVSEAHADEFYHWHEDFVINGNAGEDHEKTFKIDYLDQERKTTLISLDLSRVGIFELTTEPSPKPTPTPTPNVKVKMRVGQIRVTPLPASVLDQAIDAAANRAKSSVQILLPALGLSTQIQETIQLPKLGTFSAYGENFDYSIGSLSPNDLGSLGLFFASTTKALDAELATSPSQGSLSSRLLVLAALGSPEALEQSNGNELSQPEIRFGLSQISAQIEELLCLEKFRNQIPRVQTSVGSTVVVARCQILSAGNHLLRGTQEFSWLQSNLGGSCSVASSIAAQLIEYLKAFEKEAREDQKIARADKAALMGEKLGKLESESAKIAAMKEEASQRYEAAMTAATLSLFTGVVSGALEITGALNGGHQQPDGSDSTIDSKQASEAASKITDAAAQLDVPDYSDCVGLAAKQLATVEPELNDLVATVDEPLSPAFNKAVGDLKKVIEDSKKQAEDDKVESELSNEHAKKVKEERQKFLETLKSVKPCATTFGC